MFTGRKTVLVLSFAVGFSMYQAPDRFLPSAENLLEQAGMIGSANAQTQINSPRGRTPQKIENGVHPASYFPNTELLAADEMRITALGTGMPNQTKRAVSISYLVELGNGDNFISTPVWA